MKSHESLVDAYAKYWNTSEFRNRIALEDADASLSYGRLFSEVGLLAGRLRAAGIRDRQLVAIAMERSVQSVVAILATMVAGACPCPLEPRLTRQEIIDRLHSVAIDTVLADSSNKESLGAIDTVSIVDVERLAEAAPFWSDGIGPMDPGLLLFTSGSTGRPKGVLQSHAGLLNNACGLIPVTGLTAADRLLHMMPLYHTNGLNNQLFSPFLAGATVILGKRFRAQDMPGLLDQHQPTIITGVPTMYSRMLDHQFSADSLKRLRFARCGSAPITSDLHARIEAFLGRPLIVSYGLSEATCTSTMNPPDKRKIGSIGKPLPGQRVFLRSSEGQEITQTRLDGEICIEGASLMLGYVGVTEDGVLEPAPHTLRTGDLGRFDEEGYLYITGRIKDVIIRGGENLSPTLIEQVISADPAVLACCVVGKSHHDLGEVPVAFVVASSGCQIDKQNIRDMVAEKLSRIYRLDDVLVVDSLPENSIGKIDRKALIRALSV